MTNLQIRLLAFFVLAWLCLPSSLPANPDALRNPNWAQPVQMEGVANFYMVDDGLYRSEQPTAKGFENLNEFGIASIINLRESDTDRKLAPINSTKLISTPLVTWEITDESVAAALRAIRSADKPVLVHCRHGADRTGLIIALYRVMYQGWTKGNAKDEMLNGGYGFHSIWSNIPDYLDEVDIEKLRGMVE